MTHSGDNAHKTDAELVELALRNQRFFASIVERYQGKLARYIRRLARLAEEDVEDMLQEVFIKVYRNLNDFDQKQKFSSWIYRIAHNEVMSGWRRIKARPRIEYDVTDEKIVGKLVADVDLEQEALTSDMARDISELLNKIPAKYRAVLVLKYWEDKSYVEIAEILHKPVGTVGTLLAHAKRTLKKLISKKKIKF